MAKIKKNNTDAYNYLNDVPLELWARHMFDQELKVPKVTNNFVESLNGKIRELRSQPILTMPEGFRRRCMKKLEKKRRFALKWDDQLCPRVKKMVDCAWGDGYFCKPIASGYGVFEVKDGHVYVCVDLNKWTCMCQVWQNVGTPCKHAASAIRYLRKEIIGFVHPCYSKEAYLRTYEGFIHPIPDLNMWPKDDQPRITHLELTRRAGRPKTTQRHKEKGETPNMKRSTIVRCSICKCVGHNKRDCQGGETKKQKSSKLNNSGN
ncbi:uncharacterized protein LOC110727730 [Chenopodium quinoa]|uniref:uncharacterized protein LOC110727730 n=1 Tax=Chenopodium quinoa TaxID=63459 RepID=UPI000B7869B7|nr:uncharacterized protein LOC110727730 [Chenopodium quinoa]